VPKRLKSADVYKAKINKNIARHCEDDLDKRLREVEEEVQLFNQAHHVKNSKKHKYNHTRQDAAKNHER